MTNNTYKSKLCWHFNKGQCYLKNKCNFAHGIEDIDYTITGRFSKEYLNEDFQKILDEIEMYAS
jgi:hypothetical protein